MITTRDGLISGLANGADRQVIDKASLANAAAGQFFSLWTSAGSPGVGAAPTATPAVCTQALTGSFAFTNQTAPSTSYFAWLTLTAGNSATNLEIHDRLAHRGALSGTVTTAQGSLDLTTTSPSAGRIGSANYDEVQWWLEIYTALGGTSVNATVNVTYDDASTGNLTAFALGTTPRAGRLYPLVSAVGGKYIRAVNSVTLSATTGTAGNFGITATRPRTAASCPLLNKTEIFDWSQLGLPEIENDSCLAMIMLCGTTSTGTVRGQSKIVHG
jgi:hypothetical protein